MATATTSRAERRKNRAATRNEAGQPGKDGSRKRKGPVREWIEALVFAAVVMLFVRTFFVDQFRIPTGSMENNLLVGDFLFVSKLHYGVRTPVSLGIPFTSIHVPGLELPYTRLPGFSEVERKDAFVFNWPGDDLRLPIDRRQHYVKRAIGMPGDTYEIIDGVVHIDGQPLPDGEGYQHAYFVIKKDARTPLSPTRLKEMGAKEVYAQSDPGYVVMVATKPVADAVAALPYVERVERTREPEPGQPGYIDNKWPQGQGYTSYNYGPIELPAEGQTFTFTGENWPYLAAVINAHEGHRAERRADGTFLIDGRPAAAYTFSQDYFFAMGDNRDDSLDSRFWGPVPMNHVIGNSVMTYFSWNGAGGFPFVRFERILKPIRQL